MPNLTPVLSLVALAIAATGAHAAPELEPRTEAAVLAADDDWLAAERRGDVAALNARLAPACRDITPEGKVHLKAVMLNAVDQLKTKSTEPAVKLAAEFRAAHPMIETVMIVADTAMLSFHAADPAQQALVRSMDVFVYDNGMWRGVVSVHAAVAPTAAG